MDTIEFLGVVDRAELQALHVIGDVDEAGLESGHAALVDVDQAGLPTDHVAGGLDEDATPEDAFVVFGGGAEQ